MCCKPSYGLLKITKKHWTMDYRCLWVRWHLHFCTTLSTYCRFCCALWVCQHQHQQQHKHQTALSPSALALPKAHETIKTVFIWICLWWGPLLALDLILGTPLLAQVGYFFSKLAVVTFGGAYAVLAYMAQDVVGQLNWLTPVK